MTLAIDEEMVEIPLEVIFINSKIIFATDGDIRIWLPLRRLIYDSDELMIDTLVNFTMAEWLAEYKGLI
ncbi:MAG: hypothetical protein KAG92_02315 [Deltaproteobacteria bacterium]|nr:hypothetical protein [Deltaproteobacteria bacterium]